MHLVRLGYLRQHDPFEPGETVRDFTTAKVCDTVRFGRYFHEMLQRGVYLPPSQFEAMFVSAAHTEADITAVAAVAHDALKVVADSD